ncbi:UNVERIFIED_CONTAM: hypothetical protein HDU68_006591 [Siphonaria sp. JEL0065]|nr:hypothetical protein HDU68_006591 [Siphonaria sp. JEL0065]
MKTQKKHYTIKNTLANQHGDAPTKPEFFLRRGDDGSDTLGRLGALDLANKGVSSIAFEMRWWFSYAVVACNEPVVGSSVVYDPYAGQAIYFGGESCADPKQPTSATASNYICSQPCNGLPVEYIDVNGKGTNTSNIPQPTTFQCCALDVPSSIMHCLGGVTPDPRSVIYRFDVRNSVWISPVTAPSNLAQRTGHSCTISQSILYVFGGLTLAGQDVASPFFSYDIKSGSFNSAYSNSSVPGNRHGHVLLTLPLNSLMLLFGATTAPTVSQLQPFVFNTTTSIWSPYASTVSQSVFPQILDGASCTAWSSSANKDGGVFCFGGETPSIQPNPHLIYLNLTTNSWSDLGIPPSYENNQFTPSGTFGATISVLNGGTAVVVKAGGAAVGNGVATYLSPQNTVRDGQHHEEAIPLIENTPPSEPLPMLPIAVPSSSNAPTGLYSTAPIYSQLPVFPASSPLLASDALHPLTSSPDMSSPDMDILSPLAVGAAVGATSAAGYIATSKYQSQSYFPPAGFYGSPSSSHRVLSATKVANTPPIGFYGSPTPSQRILSDGQFASTSSAGYYGSPTPSQRILSDAKIVNTNIAGSARVEKSDESGVGISAIVAAAATAAASLAASTAETSKVATTTTISEETVVKHKPKGHRQYKAEYIRPASTTPSPPPPPVTPPPFVSSSLSSSQQVVETKNITVSSSQQPPPPPPTGPPPSSSRRATETVTTTTKTITQTGGPSINRNALVEEVETAYVGRGVTRTAGRLSSSSTETTNTSISNGYTYATKTNETILERVRRFLISTKSTHGGKFDARTFEILALVARPGFEISLLLQDILEVGKRGEAVDAMAISEAFYQGRLDVSAEKQLELLIALAGTNEAAILNVFEELKSCLVEVGSVAVFLGALHPLCKEPEVRLDQVQTVVQVFMQKVGRVSTTSRFALSKFTRRVREQNRTLESTFGIEMVLPAVFQNSEAQYTKPAFRLDLHNVGVDVSSIVAYHDYLTLLCGSVEDAGAILQLFSRTVKLLGPVLFLKAVKDAASPTGFSGTPRGIVRSNSPADSFEEYWERFPSRIDEYQSGASSAETLLKTSRDQRSVAVTEEVVETTIRNGQVVDEKRTVKKL